MVVCIRLSGNLFSPLPGILINLIPTVKFDLTLYFGEKRVVLRGSIRSTLRSKLAVISSRIKRANTMEKQLRVFRGRSHPCLVVRLLN